MKLGAHVAVNQGDDVLASVTVSGSAAAVAAAEQAIALELQKFKQRQQGW